MTSDRYFQNIVQKIDVQPIDDIYKTYIENNIRFLKYGNKNVILITIY
jgi:S-adenosylmethionine:tRNA-ribosyltransferase-isomerase (queuine synthetase)